VWTDAGSEVRAPQDGRSLNRGGGFSRVDGSIEFYTRVNALLGPDMTVVDFGAGRGAGVLDDPVRYGLLDLTLRRTRDSYASVVARILWHEGTSLRIGADPLLVAAGDLGEVDLRSRATCCRRARHRAARAERRSPSAPASKGRSHFDCSPAPIRRGDDRRLCSFDHRSRADTPGPR
jgi:hypothetical protein